MSGPARHELAAAMPMPMTGDGGYRLTIVDDSDEFVSMVAEVLAGRYVVTGVDPRSMEDLARTDPHVLMVDLNPRDTNAFSGLRVISEARAHRALRHVPIILCSGHLRGPDVERALHHPGVQLLTKPFALDDLDATLARAVEAVDSLTG